MLPQNTCNLVAALTAPRQSDDLDWNLHLTTEWESRVPFHSYVSYHPTPTSLPKSASSFPHFSRLPSELQNRILSFCAAPTLFQAMQASYIVRAEASKLFWTDSEMYFPVPAYWLLEGGYPGYTWWDSGFQDFVQNLEIEFHSGTERSICPQSDEGIEIRQDRIAAFWSTLRERFPNAKKVLVNLSQRIPSCWEDSEPVPVPLRALIHACPTDMIAIALVLEEEKHTSTDAGHPTHPPVTRWRRSLYQPGAGSSWERSVPSDSRRTVLMPPKQFKGPVGEFRELEYRGWKTALQRRSLWPLMIQALEQLYFGHARANTWSCPSRGCSVSFTKAGEWIVHAAEQHCREWRELELVPDELRAAFDSRQGDLREQDDNTSKRYKATKAAWNDGEQRQREIERGWMEQLDSDKAWDTGKIATKSTLWTHFSQQMSPNWEGFYED